MCGSLSYETKTAKEIDKAWVGSQVIEVRACFQLLHMRRTFLVCVLQPIEGTIRCS